MENKITIIEGPPPTFEAVQEGWVLGLNESSTLGEIAMTRLRTYNGPGLVERCHRAWRNRLPIHLEFRSMEGLQHEAPIVAARTVGQEPDQMLLLWVRLEHDEVELEFDFDDDYGDDLDDDEDDLEGPDYLF